MNLKQIYAIAKKEVKLGLRFKYNFVFETLLSPLRLFVLFVIVYTGFFSSGASNVGNVEKENYLLFLLLGASVYSFFSLGFSLFYVKFYNEKYWKTIQALLIAPIDRIDLIMGVGLSEIVKLSLTMPFFFGMAFILSPTHLSSFIVVLVTILLLFLGVLSFSLIQGAFTLSNENFLFLFTYIFWIWGILSCFYYPIEALPDIVKPLVRVNPIYHGLVIVRGVWVDGYVSNFFVHFLFVLAFAILTPAVSIPIFNKVIKKYGATGY